MKTKLALLAVALVVSFSSTSAFAGQPTRVIYGPKGNILAVVRADSTPSTPAKPAFKACCDTRNNVMPNASGKGVTVTKQTTCNTGCAAPHAGNNCTAAERKQCTN